jgi:HNH endonuclease
MSIITIPNTFSTGAVIVASHHIKEWSKYPELIYVKSNGLTLCRECHLEVHRKKK